MEEIRYFERLAACYVRAYAKRTGKLMLPEEWLESNIDVLLDEELTEIVNIGQEAGLKMYRFKATHSDLPRVKRVLGFLRGLEFESLLDVGSGRGVFLFPFLTEFPSIEVTSADILPHRVQFLQEIADGGIDNLKAVEMNICEAFFEENSVDIVTMLEVLEHIPDVEAAVKTAVKIARKYIIVSVPSKPDDNPEHIHLLTKERLTELFEKAGCKKLKFDGVNGHLIMIAMQ